MTSRDDKDIFGGFLLAAFGGATLWYTLVNYDLGTFSRMGTGMFPAALAAILLVFGLIQAGQAFRRAGTVPEIRVRQPFFILASIAVFALCIQTVGLFPAIVGVTVLSSLADATARLTRTIALAAVLCLLGWLIFSLGLGLNLPMLRWPL